MCSVLAVLDAAGQAAKQHGRVAGRVSRDVVRSGDDTWRLKVELSENTKLVPGRGLPGGGR